jgi:hypothetical protein
MFNKSKEELYEDFPTLFLGLSSKARGYLAMYLSLGPNRTYTAVAEHFGVTAATIGALARKYDFKKRADTYDLTILGNAAPKFEAMSIDYYQKIFEVYNVLLENVLKNKDKILKNIKFEDVESLNRLIKFNDIAQQFINLNKDEGGSAVSSEQTNQTVNSFLEAMSALKEISDSNKLTGGDE